MCFLANFNKLSPYSKYSCTGVLSYAILIIKSISSII